MRNKYDYLTASLLSNNPISALGHAKDLKERIEDFKKIAPKGLIVDITERMEFFEYGIEKYNIEANTTLEDQYDHSLAREKGYVLKELLGKYKLKENRK